MWLRVDDKLPDHPKIRGLDAVALAVWLCAACWSAEYEQDGRIARDGAQQLATRFDPQLSLLSGEEPPVVARLVAAGLWERTQDGYQIHDFLEYNPSRKSLVAERRAARARARKARLGRVPASRRSGEVRANVAGSSGVPTGPSVVRRSSTSPVVRFEGQGFQVLPERLEYWQGVYAAADVAAELRAAHAWLLANPTRRPRNLERFLVGWLKRAQDQARPRRETFEERQQRYLKVLQGGSA